jgi:hypothetical protein
MTENKIYSAIETAIIRWNLDGTKTAGELTREIMLIIKLPSDDELEEISKHEILYNDSKRGWWLEGANYILNLIKLQYEKDN